jgi:uncharacterized membrane protein HdeD (DUF308 family)
MLRSANALLWRGVFATVIGVVTLVWPDITLGAVALLFAVGAFAAGIVDGGRAFSSDRVGPVVGWLLLAGLSFVAGVVALAWPGITVLVLTLWVGAWAMVVGVLETGMAFQAGETVTERVMYGLTGLLSIIFALVLFVRPDIGAVTLAVVFGIYSVIFGVAAIILALRLRSVGKHLGGPSPLGV